MRKIKFNEVVPHVLAIAVFFVVTLMFFSPLFFQNKVLNQGDINQFVWGSKELRDFRAATGEEGLWAGSMFSGMPAYLVNLDWSDGVVVGIKKILSLFLPHPVCNIFLSFVSYYIMMLAFRIRPYLAIAAALAFGLSSFMIIGLSAGHNSRIGAMAFMPLVMAGIHLAFSGKRTLGFGITAGGLALQLRENHPQVTFYLILIVLAYGAVQLFFAWRENKFKDFGKTMGVLVIAAVVAAGTFFGPMWAILEFGKYSTRGQSELATTSINTSGSGLPKSYAFAYSNGIIEPITILIPNYYGGSSATAFVNDQTSKTYQALMNSGNEEMANRLAQYSSAYWGDQPLSAPYYGGAIIVFLFALGCLTAEKKYVWWLVSVSALAVMMSWGSNFESFNYFLFDHLPGYNKFRSVTFAMSIVFFAVPLLGMLGLERVLAAGLTKETKRKLWIAFGSTGGLCLLLFLFAGMLSYSKPGDSQLPAWFFRALHEDREALLRSDAIRSFGFITAIFILLILNVPAKLFPNLFFIFLIAVVAIDISVVDKRYFTKNNYRGKRDNQIFTPFPSDETVMKDKSYYRVMQLLDFYEAGTSQFHNSLGGYNGARIKRYQELYDSCISVESQQLLDNARKGNLNFSQYGVLNMLNTKYILYGQEANAVFPNSFNNGNAWFVSEIVTVNSANEELKKTSEIDTKKTAVIDGSKFKLSGTVNDDSLSSVTFVEQIPYRQKFTSQSTVGGLAVFSEIYYPKGWHATIDGKEVPVLRVNYVLRALEIPAGKHEIVFTFDPKPYRVGNTVTMASGWVLLLVVLGSLGWSMKKEKEEEKA